MKKRSRIALLTALLAIVFAAGISVYSNYIGMQIYQESSNHLLESYAQISKTFTLFVQRNWTVLSQWDSLMSNVQTDEDVDEIVVALQRFLYGQSELAVSNSRWAKGQRRQHRRRFSGDVQQGRANRLHLYGDLWRVQDRVRDADEPQSDAGRRDLLQ